ncbi:MAG: CARDB domain-containing protein [Nanoarchaeota archaeon]
MKYSLFLLIFIVLSLNANASWQTYQSDLRNTGIADGIGHFPLKISNFSNEIYGTNFQPLVDDLNNDGYKELIIFSDGFLQIFDYELNLVDEKFTGNTLGQPTLFNKNIIFNSRINGKNYFFAYQYSSSGLNQKFRISLDNDADFSGIKCLKLNGINSCIFKDKLNYVHIINVDDRTDSSYNTSQYNETRQTVPAVGDIDNDDSLDAVFWFNEDNRGGYGFLVFDLNSRSLNTNFNKSGIVDDIFSPAFGSPQSFILKGQPVLADLDNDNKLEIAASVFYLNCVYEGCDWYTELFVYSYNGSKLFSKCGMNPSRNCNDGSNSNEQWEGTNPFVIDANNDLIDNICFIKDKKINFYPVNMTINCYNYSGDLVLDSSVFPYTLTVQTATVADMDNDGKKDIITENHVYAQNGTSILGHDFGSKSGIPVDIDGNKGLDVVLSKDFQTKLFIDSTGAVKVSDILINPFNPSVEDFLSCQWKVNGNNKWVSATAIWYKNNDYYGSEDTVCINSTLCSTVNYIHSSALSENDVWKCSVTATEGSRKSLPKSDTALILGKNNEWTSLNKNPLSYGISAGNGYFTESGATMLIYNSSGTEFQPMIADIDANGENEIVVFSNNSLILFNKNLNVISQKQTGNLRGQFDIENMDNDPYLEIIAVVNDSSNDNFVIFEFDGISFNIETMFDVTSQNGFQDIRCIDFDKDNSKECIFRDFNGIVHSYQINATSQFDDELNVNISDKEDNVYASNVNIAPSFVDFNRDNGLDALFWFNDNFIVVDSNKNIILNVDVGALNSAIRDDSSFLGLKFVNLDKAADYEIAVAYRHDYPKGNSYKTDINLSLFNSQGKALFSKIIDFYNVNPCLNDNVHCLGFGSDLIVYDYNKDGFDDIGIYVDATSSSPYGTFIKFFDRNGKEIASNRIESNEGSSISKSISLADTNNDNELDLILKRSIYSLDGNILYNFTETAIKPPIVVDVDNNKALDLLWFNSSQLLLLLDNNTRKADLFIEEKDLSFQPLNSTSVLATLLVHNNGRLNLDNVKVRLANSETLETVDRAISVRGSNINFTGILGLEKYDKVIAQVDYDDSIEESDEENNFAEKEFEGLPYVYIDISEDQNLKQPLNEIKSYIKKNLVLGYFTDDKSNADIQIYLGKTHTFNRLDRVHTREKYGWGYESLSTIEYFDRQADAPYAGIAGSYILDGKHYIAIYGNSIDGSIAAAMEFVKRQAEFLGENSEASFFIDDENVPAISVYDYLHQPGNEQFYGEDSKEFANVVRNVLNGETFSTELRTVTTTDGVQLRLKHLIPNRSLFYMEVLNVTGVPVDIPVVLSRGIHSNLTTWETLAGEFADYGRDTWLIEITGGPYAECDECPNYDFSDLTDKYWPALINGILNFTGKDKLQYVGHSNGGRIAIESLANGMVNPNKIDTLIGVAVPSAFEGYSTFGFYFGKYGAQIMEDLQGKAHVSMTEIGIDMRKLCKIDAGCRLLTRGLVSDNKMSFNTDKQLYLWIINTTDPHIGKNLELNNFYIIQGWVTNEKDKNISHDFIVTEQDEKAIYGNIGSSNKKHYKLWGAHTAGWDAASLPDRTITKNIIKDALNKNSLNKYKSNEISST